MKKISLQGLDLDAYTETLKNGLEVVLIPFQNKKNYFISYATRFGSEITTFIPAGEDKEITVPAGIAHFLEHKMFEQEDGVDPFTYFAESGTGANASTSYNNTQYICYGTKNFLDNLRYLITYVNQPFYTDENVEKEKGIIAEEIKMYQDIPEWQLEAKLRENIYYTHPRRVDIGGTISEINKITKEDLYMCYNNFYSPNNMFILAVGNFDVEEAAEVIHEKLDNITNKQAPKVKPILEEKKVRVKEETIYSNIKLPKIGIGIKVPTDRLKEYDDLTIDLYLEMITTIALGNSSEFRERVRNKKLLNSFYTEWETIENFKTFMIIASSNEPDELIKEIKKEFASLKIDDSTLKRMKKVWIANEVKMADYIDSVVNNTYDDLIRYKKIIPNKIAQIRNLSITELNNILQMIDFKNCAIVKLLSNDK